MKPTGIFGGTFDPIHFGHLRTAFELLHALELAEVRFIPAGDPPHRDQPMADAAMRLEMVKAAIEGQPGFVVDDREVRRSGPSYTVNTLREMRAELAGRPLCLIVGMDAFLGLPTWHQWQDLLDLCHLAVAHRPGWQAPGMGPLGELLRKRSTARIADLHEHPGGRILIHPVTQLEISATELRALVGAGRDPRYLVPDRVREIIHDSGCYVRRPTR